MESFQSVAKVVEGLVSVKSPRSVESTMDRFESLAKQKGMTIFARIDHAAGAAKVDKALRPTQVLIFGNPQGGTPFMECSQTVGIDLPLKVLAWEDAFAQVWLSFNDPEYLAQRHDVAECSVVGNLRKTLDSLVDAVVSL